MIMVKDMSLSEQARIPVQSYDLIAATLGITYTTQLAEALIAELEIGFETRVLDLGCGSGGDAGLIRSQTGASVIGVDKSLDMLAIASEAISRVRADVHSVPFGKGTFDCIYAVNLLQLISNRSVFFTEAFRLLSHRGRLGLPITTPLQVRHRFINRFFSNLSNIEVCRFPSPKKLCSELYAAGFDHVRVKPISLGHFFVNQAYVERLRTGIFSGLLLLDDDERKKGFAALDAAVKIWEKEGKIPKIKRRRSLVIARKN